MIKKREQSVLSHFFLQALVPAFKTRRVSILFLHDQSDASGCR
jgi:hypothetical protein